MAPCFQTPTVSNNREKGVRERDKGKRDGVAMAVTLSDPSLDRSAEQTSGSQIVTRTPRKVVKSASKFDQ